MIFIGFYVLVRYRNFDRKRDTIDMQNKIFVFHEKQYKMPPLLIRALSEIYNEYKSKKRNMKPFM